MGQLKEKENTEKIDENPIENETSTENVEVSPELSEEISESTSETTGSDELSSVEEISEPETPLRKVTNKFLDFLLALNKKIEPIAKSPFGKFLLVLLIFALVAVPIVLIVLGFDNYFINSQLKGVVMDIQGNPIENAKILLQDKEVISNDKGEYEFTDLDYGKWKVKVSADGYEVLEEDMTLERFGNTKNFELYPLDFGNVAGKLVDDELKLQQSKLRINDLEVPIKEDGTFSSERLVVGGYTLYFESPYYKDIEQSIEIKSGNNTIPDVKLTDSGDILGMQVDFLGEDKLSDVTIKVRGTDSQIEDGDEGFKLKDLNVGDEIELSFEKEGYKNLVKKVKIVQGENSLDKVRLVPNGKIVSYVGNSIQMSDLDGKNVTNLTAGRFDCKYLFESGDNIISKCQDKVIASSKTNGIQTVVANGLNSLGGVTKNMSTITVSNTGTGSVSMNSNVVFEAPNASEDVLSWVSNSNGSTIYISTTSSVYKKDLNNNDSAQKITDGVFIIKEISPDDSSLITLNSANSAGTLSNIWKIGTDGSKTRLTVFPKAFIDLTYLDGNRIAYSASESGKINLYIKDFNSSNDRLIIDNIERFIFNKGRQLLTSTIGSSFTILNLDGKSYKVQ